MSANNANSTELTTIHPMAMERSGDNTGMSISDMERMGAYIANSKMFGIQTQDQAVALMMLCQSEGLHPMQAVRRFHLIQGKASMRADAMLAEFQDKGGTVEWTERTNDAVSGIFSHPKGGTLPVTWTMEDAINAGLTGNPTWKKFPRQMLTARVISEAIRTILPGVVSGIYTPEEVSDFDDVQRPRHQSPQGPPAQSTRQPMQIPAPAPKSLESGEAGPDPDASRITKQQINEAMGKFADEAKRLGLDVESETKPGQASRAKMVTLLEKAFQAIEFAVDLDNLSPADWDTGRQALPAYVASLTPAPPADAVEAEVVPETAATPFVKDDPFSDDDPFAESPDATPVLPKKAAKKDSLL